MNYKIEKEDEVGKERRDGCGPRSQGEVSETMITMQHIILSITIVYYQMID